MSSVDKERWDGRKVRGSGNGCEMNECWLEKAEEGRVG